MIELSLAMDERHPIAGPLVRRAPEHGVQLNVEAMRPIHHAFGPMIERAPWDLAELSAVSAFQAVDRRPACVPLPVSVFARHQLPFLLRRPDGPDLAGLRGARIGVRSLTQTTTVWVRTLLDELASITVDDLEVVATEAPSVALDRLPTGTRILGTGEPLIELLDAGEVDAIIVGRDQPGTDRLEPVVADAADRARAWATGAGHVPVNHLLALRRDLATPSMIGRMLGLAHAAAADARAAREAEVAADGNVTGGPDLDPVGAPVVRAMERLGQAVAEQGLVTRGVRARDLGPAFADASVSEPGSGADASP